MGTLAPNIEWMGGARRVALLARIDRCVSLPTPLLRSRSARAAMLDPATDIAGLSDHAPVGIRWAARPRERLGRIPEWDARHRCYPEKFKESPEATIGYADRDVSDRLRAHVGVLHMAADELTKGLRCPQQAAVGARRFHRCSALAPVVRWQNRRRTRQSLLCVLADLAVAAGAGYRIVDDGVMADRLRRPPTHYCLNDGAMSAQLHRRKPSEVPARVLGVLSLSG